MSPVPPTWLDSAQAADPVVHAIMTVFATAVGAIIGSFINVVAARVPAGESVVTPRSRCPSCGVTIAWYDNVPVLSYFVLRARCRRCRAPISWHYPAVEALAAVLALGLWLSRGPSLALLVDGAVVGLLLALALIDARTFLLPERLSLPLLAIALAGRGAVPLVDAGGGWPLLKLSLLDGVGGAALGALLLGGVAWLGTRVARRTGRIGPDEDAMGFGDITLIAGIGAHVGTLAVLPVVFLGSIQGALVGSLLLLLRRDGPDAGTAPERADGGGSAAAPADGGSSEGAGEEADDAEADDAEEEWHPPRHAVPFGPFLALGAVEWILFDDLLRALLGRMLGSF